MAECSPVPQVSPSAPEPVASDPGSIFDGLQQIFDQEQEIREVRLRGA